MCGRYALYETDKLERRFSASVTKSIKPNYNVAPTQEMPVIRNIDGANTITLMKWGIPRPLGEDKVIRPFNTRSDKAFGSFWKKQVTQQRVLVPANLFYEWRQSDKTPFKIELDKEELFAFAGIWNTWAGKDGVTYDAFSIMTTEPNNEMSGIHNRMPVILHKEDEKAWLNSELSMDQIAGLLVPSEDGRLKTIEVSTAVNSVKNNTSDVLKSVIK